MRVPCWMFGVACAISFILGRRSRGVSNEDDDGVSGFSHSSATTRSDDVDHPAYRGLGREQHGRRIPNDEDASTEGLRWELNMRRARPYNGITVPQHNGYSAKCIPDGTMKEMNANYDRRKMNRKNLGLMDGMFHEVELSIMQVGKFVSENMKYDDDGRPIWTKEIWDYIQVELEAGNDCGPPNYANSGRSVANAVNWALQNTLKSCGREMECQMSVFSAISPWAEAILYWSSLKQQSSSRPRNVRISSVDFNPCVLEDIPYESIAECRSPLSFLEKPDTPLFDLTVSYSGIEHDGLGRYNDPVNPDGDVSAMREMWLLTRPGGMLLLAVPRAGPNSQPKTSIPIWGNKKIQVLQHRAYGAERYMRLLVGWAFEGYVLAGGEVVELDSHDESIMTSIVRMLECSFTKEYSENQPLLILRRLDSKSFDDVLDEGEDWSDLKVKFYEEDYNAIVRSNVTCHLDSGASKRDKGEGKMA